MGVTLLTPSLLYKQERNKIRNKFNMRNADLYQTLNLDQSKVWPGETEENQSIHTKGMNSFINFGYGSDTTAQPIVSRGSWLARNFWKIYFKSTTTRLPPVIMKDTPKQQTP